MALLRDLGIRIRGLRRRPLQRLCPIRMGVRMLHRPTRILPHRSIPASEFEEEVVEVEGMMPTGPFSTLFCVPPKT